jgi:Holliday junction resolvase RusA-like endonuclease
MLSTNDLYDSDGPARWGDNPPAACFWVPGLPAPGGSKRAFVVKGRAVVTDDCRRNRSWRDRVADVAVRAYGDSPLLSGPLELHMAFYFTRPASHYRTGKHALLLRDDAPKYPTKKPDLTKVIRSSEDALTGILWKDDASIVRQVCTKEFGEKPGVSVCVRRIA